MSNLYLGDISTKIGSGATPTGGKNSYQGGKTALIRSQNVKDMQFDYQGLAFINDEQAQKLNGVEVKSGDILFNITGDSVARCCIVPDNILPARVNQHVAIIRTPNVNSHYVMYELQYLKPYLLSISNNGSSRHALTKENLENLEIKIDNNQDEIANFLDMLSNKIINNNNISSQLESLLKTIYDHWFLQFDYPNENGRPYKLSGGKMAWNKELKREIPSGWKCIKLKEISELVMNGINPLDNPNSTYIHYSIPAFDDYGYPAFEYGSEINSGKYSVPNNSILVSKLNPQFKRIWEPLDYVANAVCSTEFMPFVPKNIKNKSYLYSILNSDTFQKYMVQCSSSSTGSRKRIQPELCEEYEFAYPDSNKEIIEKYCEIADVIQKSKLNIAEENHQLTSLRDYLLPMLMNGQVTFKEQA